MKVRKTIVISTTQHKPCSRTIINISMASCGLVILVINIINLVLPQLLSFDVDWLRRVKLQLSLVLPSYVTHKHGILKLEYFDPIHVKYINIFDYTVLLLALIAAETAMALSLIIGSRGLSGRLSVRNNVSNYSTYLPKCQRLLSGPLGRRHPSGAVHMAPSYICYMDNCFCNE